MKCQEVMDLEQEEAWVEVVPAEVKVVLAGGQGGGFAAGPRGYCICPNCGERAAHQSWTPCYEQQCSKFGTAMVRE